MRIYLSEYIGSANVYKRQLDGFIDVDETTGQLLEQYLRKTSIQLNVMQWLKRRLTILGEMIEDRGGKWGNLTPEFVLEHLRKDVGSIEYINPNSFVIKDKGSE